MSLENAASIGRTGQDYTEYVERLTDLLMVKLNEIHGEYERKIKKLRDTIHLQSPRT